MTDMRRIVHGFDVQLPVERAWTPPSAWYTDPAMYALEQRTVFRRSWQPVAGLGELRATGDFVSGCFGGEPWVVTRDGTELRALANVCRHKGREVVTGCGRAAELVCGYHAWTYDLSGRLRKAPRMAGVVDFDREAMSLPPYDVQAWGPWALLRMARGEGGVASEFPEVDAMLAATDWHKLSFAGRASWEIACNWKVYVDNYLDGGYHVPHMHPSLDAQLDMSSYATELFKRSSIQSSLPAGAGDERIDYAAADRIGARASYAWLYPNFMINRYGPCMDTNWVVPLGVERCRVDYEFYFERSEGDDAEAFVQRSMAQSDVTQREDIAICESVQRGLGSASYERGRYAPSVEHGEHHFHRLLAGDYARSG